MGNPRGIKRDFEALERRRFKAVELFKKKKGQAEVARLLGVPRQTVHRWYWAWRENGSQALKKAATVGRKRRVTRKEETIIVQALRDGPEVHGYATGVWTLPRVAEVIQRELGVKYHPAHLSRVVRALGWSCQRPTGKAKQRNEDEIRIWKRYRWPALKKKHNEKAEK